MEYNHNTVLKKESIDFLNVKPNQIYIDATLGGGGHTEAMLDKGAKVIAFDLDSDAINNAKEKYKDYIDKNQLILVKDNFRNIDKAMIDLSINSISGALLDLGFSTQQIKTKNVGLSFNDDTELDMRMDESLNIKAIDLLRVLSEKDLMHLFIKYGDVEKPKLIASKIKSLIKAKSNLKANELADYISKLYRGRKDKLHPATKVFLALRVAVNDEIGNLDNALSGIYKYLNKQGRVAVITFNSLEEKTLINRANELKLSKVTPKPILPTREEIFSNISARSAKLYIYEKN